MAMVRRLKSTANAYNTLRAFTQGPYNHKRQAAGTMILSVFSVVVSLAIDRLVRGTQNVQVQ
jgi:hypothetical protein